MCICFFFKEGSSLPPPPSLIFQLRNVTFTHYSVLLSVLTVSCPTEFAVLTELSGMIGLLRPSFGVYSTPSIKVSLVSFALLCIIEIRHFCAGRLWLGTVHL